MLILQKSIQSFSLILLSAGVYFCAVFSSAFSQTVDHLSAKKANEQELIKIRAQLEASQLRHQTLKTEIAALNQDIGAINRALITATKRSQKLETEVSHAEKELEVSIQEQSGVKQKIYSKRAVLAEVLAALQRLGHNPPPAILIRPEDALSSIRSAIVLGAVVPSIRSEMNLLVSQLIKLKDLTAQVSQRKEALTEKLNALSEDEARLTLLIEEKNVLTIHSMEEFDAQQKKVAALASKARSLEDLIYILEEEIEDAAKAAESAKQADANRLAEEGSRLQNAKKNLESSPNAFSDTARIKPAIAFSSAKGKLFLPASGKRLYNFGDKLSDKSGGAVILGARAKNIAIQTRANARVRAPADGWVVYAGPFRSFGNLLILNAGQGYHVILSGLDHVNVAVGRFVLAGEPVGRMGASTNGSMQVSDFGSKNPILYVEFRKDGRSIDSGPWWAPRITTLLQAGNG